MKQKPKTKKAENRLLCRMHQILIITLLAILPVGLFAQTNVPVVGAVVDNLGEPLIGVTVSIKGTTKGSLTDLDGKFTIETPANGTLTISYVGYKSKDIKVEGKPNLGNIVLQEDTQVLNEVVVVGYGTMEKRAVTSSITSIGADDMVQGIGGTTLATALQGKVNGLVISGLSSPNAASSIQLRGLASINSSKNPLIVIDGIPGGDIRSVNQEDVQSIDVLKDASAGAIYGTRAAAGVILITTKQAKEGPMKLTYTGEFSLDPWRKKPEVLSAEEFVAAGLGTDYGARTNWMDEISHTPLSHRQVINMSGGNKAARLYSTFTLADYQGKIIGDRRRDWSGRVNGSFSLMDNLVEIRTHVEYRESNRDQRANGDHMYMGIKLNPTIPVYDLNNQTGYNVLRGGWEEWNPVADINLRRLTGIDRWLKADATIKVNILPELSAQATVGYEMRDYDEDNYISAYHKESVDGGYRGKAKLYYDKSNFNTMDAFANYIKSFGEHNVNITGGYSFYERKRHKYDMTNYNFPVDAVGSWDIGQGSWLSDGNSNVQMVSLTSPLERLIAFFGRANYSYKDKYMATASIRYEGSSKFQPNHRWGAFWSISGGYRISEEAFMKDISWLNDLKLRIGYGVTGNNGFAPGISRSIYQPGEWWLINGTWQRTYGQKHNANPDLAWEVNKEWDFGVDYSFLDNRLYGKFDLYQRNIKDMLYDINVAVPSAVYDKTTMNAGSLKTSGWEFEIGADLVRTKDFKYSSTMRFSHSTTKITELAGISKAQDILSMPSPGSPGTALRLEIGETIGQYYIWRFAGFDDNGEWLLYDRNNNVIPASEKKNEDKAYVGNAIPKLIASWDHTIFYKNWDFSLTLRSWIDYDIFNTLEMYLGVPNVNGQNVLKAYYDRNKDIKGEKQLSDYFLHDGTFLKIESINLGYNWDIKSKFLNKARFYMTLRDVAYITKYKGLNPEVDVNGLEPGFEWFRRQGGTTDRGWKKSIYPQTIHCTFGVQLTF